MPCSKGMRDCRAGCLHRASVEEYRLARHAQLLREEAETIGDPWMIAERKPAISFRQWLVGRARRASRAA